jgi:hypothetical protein
MRVLMATTCAATAMLAACGGASTAPSAEENRDLDSAARMLDEAPNSLKQVDDSGLAENASDEPGGER